MEQRAFRIVNFGVRHEDDALDIVQDAMLKLATKYGTRRPEEWPALFYRILQNRVRDYHRRNKVSRRWLSWFDQADSGEGENAPDLLAAIADGAGRDGAQQLALDRGMEQLQASLQALPYRQQQVFLLRCWEGLDTKQTAAAMGCSEGSVKTHYFRALNALKGALGEHWE